MPFVRGREKQVGNPYLRAVLLVVESKSIPDRHVAHKDMSCPPWLFLSVTVPVCLRSCVAPCRGIDRFCAHSARSTSDGRAVGGKQYDFVIDDAVEFIKDELPMIDEEREADAEDMMTEAQSLAEERKLLPVFRQRQELIQAIRDHQVRVYRNQEEHRSLGTGEGRKDESGWKSRPNRWSCPCHLLHHVLVVVTLFSVEDESKRVRILTMGRCCGEDEKRCLSSLGRLVPEKRLKFLSTSLKRVSERFAVLNRVELRR